MSSRRYSVSPGWRLIMTDMGIRPTAVLKRAYLPEDLFSREKATVSTQEFFRLWVALAEDAEDPLLPLKLGEAISTEAFDPPVFAAMCSPNLNVALSRIARYKPLVCPMQILLEETPRHTRMTLEWSDKTVVPPPPLAAMELVFFVQLARMGTRNRIRPVEVTSPGSLTPAAPYREWFGTRVKSADRVSITFSANDAARPFVTANESMWNFFEPELQRTLDAITQEASMTERVKAALLELIPAGIASMDSVSKKLGTSNRTLQRNLKKEGTRFQSVLSATREELALHYLKSSTMSGAEISFLLGFDDPNSFFRAFRNWTGSTPEQFRAIAMQAN